MTRKNLILIGLSCMIVHISIYTAHGQDAELMDSGATIRGEVIEATPEQNPIEGVTVKIVNVNGNEYIVTTDKDGVYEKTGLPAGRYTISISKKGYGDRIDKSKVVASGGELFDRIKMRKKVNIVLIFLSRLFTWQLVVGFALGFVVALIINSGRSRVRG